MPIKHFKTPFKSRIISNSNIRDNALLAPEGLAQVALNKKKDKTFKPPSYKGYKWGQGVGP